jgi:AAA+ superfamily predicted ATPase
MDKTKLISQALSLPHSAIDYTVSQYLALAFPDLALVEGTESLFNLEPYAHGGHCQLEIKTILHSQIITHWVGRDLSPMERSINASSLSDTTAKMLAEEDQDIYDSARNAWFSVQWREQNLDVLVMHWDQGFGQRAYHYWILCENKLLAKNLIRSVCEWNAELRGEVLVFADACWTKDHRLYRSIQNVTFDNLILRGTLKQQISDDLEQFFVARETYETYGIPWKRGILFVGPPGNGKTHAVKALINKLHQRCLYVKGFRSQYQTEEHNILSVFERARKSAPCILVFEDLDAILTDQNRSFFLNELDGFAANNGIITLATTNHPERLDPAILDRPSRFDRKYPFELPELTERVAYINMWNASLNQSLRLSEAGIESLSALTEGYSFAYLKELFLSSMMRWIAHPEAETMEQLMTGQVQTLREQMVSALNRPDPPPGSDGDGIPRLPWMVRTH